MTSQGSAHGRFTRSIKQRNLFQAEIAAREMRGLSLPDALDFDILIAAVRPDRLERAAVRWHGRLEVEASGLTLAELSRGSRSRRLSGYRPIVGRATCSGRCFVGRVRPRCGGPVSFGPVSGAPKSRPAQGRPIGRTAHLPTASAVVASGSWRCALRTSTSWNGSPKTNGSCASTAMSVHR
jgi:hypothetical protein